MPPGELEIGRFVSRHLLEEALGLAEYGTNHLCHFPDLEVTALRAGRSALDGAVQPLSGRGEGVLGAGPQPDTGRVPLLSREDVQSRRFRAKVPNVAIRTLMDRGIPEPAHRGRMHICTSLYQRGAARLSGQNRKDTAA